MLGEETIVKAKFINLEIEFEISVGELESVVE
jgi:hypothetical protein